MSSSLKDKTFDAGSLCVWCANDTSAGSGKFVNRIPVHADLESSIFNLAKTLRDMYEYVDGYGCEECYAYEEASKND
jgi:hypothetical protein